MSPSQRNSTASQAPSPQGDAELPNLCSPVAVFLIVIISELLVLVLVISRHGLVPFNWSALASVTFLVQWIALSSTALLCGVERRYAHWPLRRLAIASFVTILMMTAIFSTAGQWMLYVGENPEWFRPWELLENLLIAAIFAGITLRYFYLQQQLRNQQQSELRARIQALHARIRPHFLFNSMNIIASLIATRPETAERVVEDLAELFRASLSDSDARIPLREEIALCERYIDIEKLRVGERLQVEWQINVHDESIKIPALLMQPLVENAIYHGIQPRPEGGTIAIRAEQLNDQLQLEVRNPVASQGSTHKGNQVAQDNIRRRLQAHYGGRAKIEVVASEVEYCVQIQLPA